MAMAIVLVDDNNKIPTSKERGCQYAPTDVALSARPKVGTHPYGGHPLSNSRLDHRFTLVRACYNNSTAAGS